MAVDVLLGLQWGDEGKGKIVDVLAKKYNIVARFQGGPNAGHTLEFDGNKHVLHQVPSGVFHPHITNVIGNGVVLDPVVFQNKEAADLAKHGIDISHNLLISTKAQLILPTHAALDEAYENSKGDSKIGSTLRGIGPTYQDKIGRQGIRVGDILAADFDKRYQEQVVRHRQILDYFGYDQYQKVKEKEEKFFVALDFLRKFKIVNTEYYINNALVNNQSVLAEGAQGSMLDIDYGTYPFVTSSNTTVAGACTGLGIAPKHVGEVFGIFKAYCTRVGSGPFPTELHDEVGEKIRSIGREFGSTTGRPRRCGWIDLPALKYAVMLSGVSQLLMMKTDILNSFQDIKAATAYKLKDGSVTSELPFDFNDIQEPIYDVLPGWNEELTTVPTFEDFPEQLKSYISYLERQLDTPISVVSIGPDRTETITRSLVNA